MKRKLQEWWRGYSDADVESLRLKLAGNLTPGALTWLTPGEFAAVLAGELK